MSSLHFYDCNCLVGTRNDPPLWAVCDPEGILREMDLCGVERAWACHYLCLDCHPCAGNAEMLTVSREHPRLRPVYAAMPHHTGEFPEPRALIEDMRASGVQMLRLFPKYNANTFSLSDWSCGPLFEELEARGVPVLLDAGQTDWETVHAVCQNHPALKLIMTNVYYRNLRYVIPLLRLHKELYLETSGLKICNGLDETAKLAGAEKLIFGTGLGELSAGSAVCIVLYSALSDEDKALVASGNLLRMLGEERLS